MREPIVNPILNSPFREPTRHFAFDSEGITSTVIEGRRLSTYFVPIPQARQRKGSAAGAAGGGASPGQQTLPGDWTSERMETSETINRIRAHVDGWRQAGRPQITPTTRDLLEYWTRPDRDRRLFFCQIEALETAIYLTEVAPRAQPWIEQALRDANLSRNPGLERMAFKMATGSGKTVVMAMLIAWQCLNKLDRPMDDRFGDTFLVVTPGITIRDRLRVLMPNATDSYYRALDLLPDDQLDRLQAATVVITNFHAFIKRETLTASATTKRLLAPDDPDRFRETDAQMVRRVLRSIGAKRNVIVLNDEAHHCYQSAPREQREQEKLTADERSSANEAEKTAAVWLNGLRAVKKKLGVRAIYDLSATPFFLRGSGYKEGTLFPWVVSDFSLIDAIESGVVKIPRVPTSDDSMTGDAPTYRELWSRIRDDPLMPHRGRDTDAIASGAPMPMELEGALVSLYGHYRRSFEAWKEADQGLPPVFIVVCQNTNISKLVFDWVAGYERRTADGSPMAADGGDPILAPGNLDLFSNVDRGADGANRWTSRPRTLLIDSAQLESGESMDPVFRKAAAAELAEFREALRLRTGAAADEDVTDEDILREVMNTVGKPGRLGESIRCVVSVSMLTEGWDANTVTHILGVRAFGTQLLCEQVVGRGLRRLSYEANAEDMFEPEYAEVYGVPFSFIPTAGNSTLAPIKPYHRVMAMPDRAHLAIEFPRVIGYRYELPRTLTEPVVDALAAALAADPSLDSAALAAMVEERFGIAVHRRSVERALGRRKRGPRKTP